MMLSSMGSLGQSTKINPMLSATPSWTQAISAMMTQVLIEICTAETQAVYPTNMKTSLTTFKSTRNSTETVRLHHLRTYLRRVDQTRKVLFKHQMPSLVCNQASKMRIGTMIKTVCCGIYNLKALILKVKTSVSKRWRLRMKTTPL